MPLIDDSTPFIALCHWIFFSGPVQVEPWHKMPGKHRFAFSYEDSMDIPSWIYAIQISTDLSSRNLRNTRIIIVIIKNKKIKMAVFIHVET